MTLDLLLDIATSHPEVEQSLPFGPDVLVLKTSGKIFLLIPLDKEPLRFNAKCDPEWAIELRASYTAILPGYHMNKRHWNTVIMDGSVPLQLVKKMIDHAYGLVAKRKK